MVCPLVLDAPAKTADTDGLVNAQQLVAEPQALYPHQLVVQALLEPPKDWTRMQRTSKALQQMLRNMHGSCVTQSLRE